MASKKEYSIEEHLYEMLLELHRLGCSEPFRLPVDVVALKALNYYDVILEPMDLSSLMVIYFYFPSRLIIKMEYILLLNK